MHNMWMDTLASKYHQSHYGNIELQQKACMTNTKYFHYLMNIICIQ